MKRKVSTQPSFYSNTQSLIDLLLKSLKEENGCDVTFVFPDKSTCKAHKFLLSLRSDIFKAQFNCHFKESLSAEIELQEHFLTSTTFSEYLSYLYSNAITLTPHNVIQMHYLSKKYLLGDLETLSKNYITNTKKSQCLYYYDHMLRWDIIDETIADICLNEFKKDPLYALEMEYWGGLCYRTVEKVLGISDMDISEVKLFEKTLNWLSVDERECYFKGVLIPLIRFPLMSSNYLVEVVKPLGILDPAEYLQALEFNASPAIFKEAIKTDPKFQKRTKKRN